MTDRETPKLTTEDKQTLTKYLERLNKTIADGDARLKDGDILHDDYIELTNTLTKAVIIRAGVSSLLEVYGGEG